MSRESIHFSPIEHLTNEVLSDAPKAQLFWLPEPSSIVDVGYNAEWNKRTEHKTKKVEREQVPSVPALTLEEVQEFINISSQSEIESRLDECIKLYQNNPSTLLDILLSVTQYELVANNLYKFLNAGVDPKHLADTLIEKGQADTVAHNLVKFPNGSVDPKYLADTLIEKGLAHIVAYNLVKFLNAGVDPKYLADTLIKTGFADVVANNLEKFPKGSVDPKYLADTLIEEGQTDIVANNLEKFPESILSPDIRSRLNISITDALAEHRYLQVSVWLENEIEKNGEVSVSSFFDKDALKKEWDILIRDGRYKNAMYLAKCMKLTGLTVPDMPSRDSIEEETLPRTIENRKHIVTDDVLDFYTDNYIAHKLEGISTSPDWAYKLDFKDRIAFEDLKRQIEKRKDDLVLWLKSYIISAVASELEHQPDNLGLKLPRIDTESFFVTATQEEILNFFDSASTVFVTSGWRTDYGGSSWSRVARAGYALWASKGDLSPIVDYIFDLQHNTGVIFDKRPDEVLQNKGNLKTILDMKREHDIPDILPDLVGICSEQVLSGVYARLRIMERMMKKVGI